MNNASEPVPAPVQHLVGFDFPAEIIPTFCFVREDSEDKYVGIEWCFAQHRICLDVTDGEVSLDAVVNVFDTTTSVACLKLTPIEFIHVMALGKNGHEYLLKLFRESNSVLDGQKSNEH